MKNIIQFKNVCFTLISDVTFKAEYSSNGTFVKKDLFITDIDYENKISYTIKKYKNMIIISTDSMIIHYQQIGKGFNKYNLQVKYRFSKRYKKWKFGQRDRKNLRGSILDLFKYPKERGKRLSEGVLSRNGYFTYYDHTFFFWDKQKKWAQYEELKEYQIFFFIGYGNDYSLGLKEFARVFGRAVMPPLWVFGFWYSRYWAYHQREFIQLVNKYRSLNIPLDVMVVDTDWRKHIWRGYEWAKKYFPNPNQFIKTMKKMNVKLTLNDHPGYNESEFLPDEEEYHKKIQQILKKKISRWRPDWSDKRDVNIFCEELLAPKLKQGIDFWWIDGWGAAGLQRHEDYFKKMEDQDKMHLGVEGYYGLNPQLWLNHFYFQTTKKVYKNKRAMVLTRWGGFGSQRYPIFFSGDTFSTWKTLAYQVYFTYTAGNVLMSYWSHDLGGFIGRDIAKELYIRWIQFGAFSPIMRTHSDHGKREPWKFGKDVVEIFRRYVRIRYRLIPYFYQYAYQAYKESIPVVRGLYHQYPKLKQSYKYKHEYLIGENILVAPVVRSMGKKRLIKKKIYFPPGEWLGIENGYVCMGPLCATLSVPLQQIPFFIKKNSIIPVNQNCQYIKEKCPDILRFEIFSPERQTIDYYEDDGVSDDYQKKGFILIPIKVLKDEHSITVTIDKMKGHYKGVLKRRRIEIVLHFIEDITLSQAVWNKKKIKMQKINMVFDEIKSYFISYKMMIPYIGKKEVIIFN